MLELGILKTFDSENHKAGLQLAGSLTTYLDDIAVATNIAAEAMITGNYVLLAIPGGNPRDACVVASWPAGSSGITDHGELDGLADDDHSQYLNVARHDLTARHPLGSVVPHESALNNIGNVNAPSPSDDQPLAWDAATSKWIPQTLGGGGGAKIQDADGDTYLWVEKTADEDKIHGVVKGVEALLIHDDGILDLVKQSSAKMDAGTTAQSINNATWTKVNYVSSIWDIQSEINLGTDRIVVKKAGIYLIITQAATYSMPDQSLLIAGIRVNGADIGSARNIASGTQTLMPLAVTIYQLSANDYIEGWVWHNSGSTKTLGPYLGQNFLIAHKMA